MNRRICLAWVSALLGVDQTENVCPHFRQHA
jgi:hypothetical protein